MEPDELEIKEEDPWGPGRVDNFIALIKPGFSELQEHIPSSLCMLLLIF